MGSSISRQSPRLFGWVAAGVTAVALIVLVVHGPLLDLHIYRMGGSELLRGGDALYSQMDSASGLGFTYPPFAATLFVPLAAIPSFPAELLLTVASALALARVCLLVHRAGPATIPHPALVLGLATLLEPVISTVCFGQINLILLWCVVEDVLGRRRRWTGVLIGIACGIKLVPGVFILLLLVSGRHRDAARAGAAIVGSVAVGFLVAPVSSFAYWTHLIFDDSRVGGAHYIGNQAISGLLARLAGPDLSPWWWPVLAVATLAVGVVTARRLHLAGDRLGALAVVAMAGLLASPISWSHHWVWLVVVIPALYAGGHRLAALAWVGLATSWCIWLVPYGGDREYGLNPLQTIVGDAYALAAIVTAAILALSAWTRRNPSRRPDGDRSRGTQVGSLSTRIEKNTCHGTV